MGQVTDVCEGSPYRRELNRRDLLSKCTLLYIVSTCVWKKDMCNDRRKFGHILKSTDRKRAAASALMLKRPFYFWTSNDVCTLEVEYMK